MSIPGLTKSLIQEHTAGGSFERGEKYLENGAVQSVTLIDDHTLKAKVQGHDVHPYLVTIQFDEESISDVECSCPYYEGTWCKHIVAVLLKTLEEGKIAHSESVAVTELVEDFSREALVNLLERLVEHDPRLIDQIERERARLSEEA